MIQNYLKIAWRIIWRNKTYSFINIFGLAIGMAVCILISMWVQDELSYDLFHEKVDQIYRIERKGSWKGSEFHTASTGPLYGKALVEDFPEVIDSTRILRDEYSFQDFRNIQHPEKVYFADNSFFNLFSYKLKVGDLSNALSQPNSILLTPEKASKFFNQENPVGQEIPMECEKQIKMLKVVGILEPFPDNSHLDIDMLISMKTYESLVTPEEMSTWTSNSFHTYVLLNTQSNRGDLANKMPQFITKYLAEPFSPFLGGTDITSVFQLVLNPVTNIHLKSNTDMEWKPSGNMGTVYVFSIIALAILITACVNFMNLSTARASKRSREVGIRKVTGASKRQLISQFLGESLFISSMGFLLSLAMVEILLPLFNHLSGKSLSWSQFITTSNLVFLLTIALFTGLISGIYPAFFLSSFNTIKVLKGTYQSSKAPLRKALVFCQFAVSITLIICTIIIFQQQQFFRSKSLGFNREKILSLDVQSSEVRAGFDTFRNELLAFENVANVCASDEMLGGVFFSDSGFLEKGSSMEDISIVQFMNVSNDFVETYEINILAGRDFSPEHVSDQENAVMINRAGLKEFNYQNPEDIIGKVILRPVSETTFKEYTVIGVLDDFHFRTLHHTINPFLIFPGQKNMNYISVKLKGQDLQKSVLTIEKLWSKQFPGQQFKYSFLDSTLAKEYENEAKTQTIVIVFTCLGIFISCLGLFGLATFSAEQRRKEIGVRKILGASVPGIATMFSMEFGKWVLLSNLVAWPLSWYILNSWLQNFAYRISINVLVFVLAGLAALLVAIFTVSFQAIKAATANPVLSLKYE